MGLIIGKYGTVAVHTLGRGVHTHSETSVNALRSIPTRSSLLRSSYHAIGKINRTGVCPRHDGWCPRHLNYPEMMLATQALTAFFQRTPPMHALDRSATGDHCYRKYYGDIIAMNSASIPRSVDFVRTMSSFACSLAFL